MPNVQVGLPFSLPTMSHLIVSEMLASCGIADLRATSIIAVVSSEYWRQISTILPELAAAIRACWVLSPV